MHPDTDITPESSVSDARITLRLDRFIIASNILGWTTNRLRAQNIGVNSVTVRRAISGEPVGEQFMMRTICAFKPHTDLLRRIGVEPDLNGLFEITTTTKAGAR